MNRVLMLAVCLAATSARHLPAQDTPSDPRIMDAAAKLNSITPQAVPQQTVRVAKIYGAGELVEWNVTDLTESLPEYKKEQVGDQARPIVGLNSYNVRYEFEFPGGAPDGMRMVFSHPNGRGGMIREVATFTQGRTLARVAFNPRANGIQRVTLERDGPDTSLTLRAHLREELGAFVVPYMLLTIVYEPPGAHSTASYEKSSSVGTTLSWGEEHSTTSVKAENPDWLIELALEGAKSDAVAAIPGYGPYIKAAATVIEAVRPNREDTTITVQAAGSERSQGWSATVTNTASTSANDNANGYVYPGRGDFFVLLRDVLFAYLYTGGTVHLAPVAYSSYTGVRGADLEARLPAAVAAQLRALDPHMTPSLMPVAGTGLAVVAQVVRLPGGASTSSGRRFRYLTTEQCVPGGGFGYGYDQAQVEGSATTSSTTTTTIKSVSGMAASLFGPTREEATMKYWSSTENTTIDAEASKVYLECGENEEFEVNGYFDKVLRTILWVRHGDLSPTASVQGNAASSGGQPLSGKPVTLEIGGQRYTVRTDAQGNFRFRFSSIPKGTGTLVADGQSIQVAYTGAPITNLQVGPKASVGKAVENKGVVRPPAVTKRPLVRPPGRNKEQP